MAIPKYDERYPDFLTALISGAPRAVSEIRSEIALRRHLTAEELRLPLDRQSTTVFASRVGWAAVYLRKAGLIARPSRGTYQITDLGKQAILQTEQPIDNHYLMRFTDFRDFFNSTQSGTDTLKSEPNSEHAPEAPTPAAPLATELDTPRDTINRAMAQLNSSLADDLMQEIMAQSPDFFERLVVQLLLKMGYGGPFEDAGIVTCSTGDGGIDGIIKEDKLGFNQIYIQAKRWAPERQVSRPEIHKFCGALQDKGASKGLFIATCGFTEGARETASRQHIVLVDGPTLTRLMIEYDLGVSPVQSFTIKRLDGDFFSEE